MLSFSIAQTEDTLSELRRFVHTVYAGQGYAREGQSDYDGLRSYIGKKGVHTIVARRAEKNIGTISLVCGHACTLPMETLYAEEVALQGKQRSELGEIGQFAIDDTECTPKGTGKGNTYTRLDITMGLLAHVIALAEKLHITHCCFTINPKHRVFYESLGCVQIGGEKEYALVEGAPALAYVLNLEDMRAPKARGSNFLVEKILQTEIPKEFFEHAQIYPS